MIALLFLLSASLYSYCQEKEPPVFVEFVVDGETSVELLRKINSDFQANPDFQVTRMDIPSERFFGVYKVGIEFDRKWFENKFKEYGLTIHCLHTGKAGVDSYQHLAKKNCSEINSK